jgi:hypothetical protein
MVAFSLFFFSIQLVIKVLDWYKADEEYTLFPILSKPEETTDLHWTDEK